MKTAANQKIVCLHKALADRENPYGIVNKDCMYRASQNLGYNEFRIYMYIITNTDNYEFALSPADIAESMGANKREIQKNINSLIKKGYLILEPDSGNRYIFREDVAKETNITGCGNTTVLENNSVEIPHRNMLENNALICGNPSQDSVEIPHRNITEDYIKSTLDSTDATLNEQTNQQLEIEPENYESIDDVPNVLVQKVIRLYHDGKKYNKKNPQIQNETGLSGTIIFQIVNKYKSGEILLKKDKNDNALWFDSGSECIDIQTIKNVMVERNVNESDEKAMSNVCKEYYEVAIKYCKDKKKVMDWFVKNFNYTYSEKEDTPC